MDSQFSKIRLNIILPENLDNLNDNQLSRLNSKITNIVTESGLSGDANGAGSFLIYPKVLFNNINTVETGIANVYTASLDITLNIKQMQKNTIFASTSFTIKGYGNSKDLAISNAIQNFPSNNEKLNLFFINSKKKIIEYYNLICNDLISNSSTLAKQKKYDEAIGLLYMIPYDVNCYNSVQEAIISYYKLLQESICNSLILRLYESAISLKKSLYFWSFKTCSVSSRISSLSILRYSSKYLTSCFGLCFVISIAILSI
jgi:hypothetical protein